MARSAQAAHFSSGTLRVNYPYHRKTHITFFLSIYHYLGFCHLNSKKKTMDYYGHYTMKSVYYNITTFSKWKMVRKLWDAYDSKASKESWLNFFSNKLGFVLFLSAKFGLLIRWNDLQQSFGGQNTLVSKWIKSKGKWQPQIRCWLTDLIDWLIDWSQKGTIKS